MSVMSFQEMVDSKDLKAYLCHRCYNKANKCVDLIDEVRQVAGDILNMASKPTVLPSAVVPRRKRPASSRVDPAVHTTGSDVLSGDPASLGELTHQYSRIV